MEARRTIPEIRDDLRKIAADMMDDGLIICRWEVGKRIMALADETRRRPPVRTTPRRLRSKITPDEIVSIREFAGAHPKMSQQRIAVHFNLNAGRISEALAGLRDGSLPTTYKGR